MAAQLPDNLFAQSKNRIFFAVAGIVLLANMLALSNPHWFSETQATEWPFAFDFLIVLPLAFLLVHGPGKRISW